MDTRLPITQPAGDNVSAREFSMMQTQWKSKIEPVTSKPSNQSLLLKNIALKNGVTVVNHLLGQMIQGWRIVDINGAATIYRSAPFTDKTLTLTSNAAVTVTLEVF